MIGFLRTLFGRKAKHAVRPFEKVKVTPEAHENGEASAKGQPADGNAAQPKSLEPGEVIDAAPAVVPRLPSIMALPAGMWKISGVSVTGEAHLNKGVPCEDSFFATETLSGFLVAVVSDGAGSASGANWASRTICESFIGFVEKLSQLDRDQLATDAERELQEVPAPVGDVADPADADPATEIAPAKPDSTSQPEQQSEIAVPQSPPVAPTTEEGAGTAQLPHALVALRALVREQLAATRETLLTQAQSENVPARSFLATVVLAIVHPKLGALTAHIGDGAATLFDADGKDLHTSQPENGEYLDETYFLVQDEWQSRLRYQLFPPGCHEVFVMSDGVTDLGYTKKGRIHTPSPKFFGPISKYLQTHTPQENETALSRMLDNERARQLVNDDKTLVWARLN